MGTQVLVSPLGKFPVTGKFLWWTIDKKIKEEDHYSDLEKKNIRCCYSEAD